MLTPAEAALAIDVALASIASESIALENATGRVLAESLSAERDLPPFDRVAMDGIAIRHSGWIAGIRRYTVDGIIGAGSEPFALTSDDHCIEVMTGAMMPPGADTVIPVEMIRLTDGFAILGEESVSLGSNIHRQASDGLAGDLVLTTGTLLRGPELAIAASVGRARVTVARQPKLAIISTGDELVGPDAELKPWQIRRSNAHGIAACLRSRAYSSLTDVHIVDDRPQLTARLGALLASHDVLILSGGVSAGRFDYVPGVLADLGVRRVFHKIAQRPGKPFWFGVSAEGKPVFALPGNPVSTLVCLVRYVLPALERLSGRQPRPVAMATLQDGWAGNTGLTAFIPVVRASLNDPAVRLHQTRGSGDFISLVGTDGFVELPSGVRLAPGAAVPFYNW